MPFVAVPGRLSAGLFVAAGPGEWRTALVEGGAAVELLVERGEGAARGAIHLGRVKRLVPALAAAHVDLGGARPAFLPQSEMFPRGARLHEGARILVQVRREAQGGKAAQVTTAIRLRGRFVALVVGRSGLLAADTLPAEHREALRAAVVPGEGGFGLAVIEPAPLEAMAAEAARLKEHWHDLCARAARLEPPCRLDPPVSPAAALAARGPLPSSIVVDDPAAVPQLRTAFPDADVAHVPEDLWPIDLDAEFARALAPSLALATGTVHIETTRAAVLIDIDSGTPETGSAARAALAVNLAAAPEIARQVRLRNLGGGLIVDFIGLDGTGARERVRAALAAALAADPAGPQILGWTRLGHLELVRPRRGRPLAEVLLEPDPGGALVKTALTVAHEALRRLLREARAQPGRCGRLLVAPEVAA
ncbi:MAG: ribonuclease E/G, partial [Stellaceae bacterium]